MLTSQTLPARHAHPALRIAEAIAERTARQDGSNSDAANRPRKIGRARSFCGTDLALGNTIFRQQTKNALGDELMALGRPVSA